MKIRQISMGRGSRLLTALGMVGCMAVLLLFWFTTPVAAISTTEKSSSIVYDSGWFYVGIADDNGLSSQVKISLTVNGTKPAYKNYLKGSTRYNCSLSVNSGDHNYHDIKLNQTTVSTEKAGSGNYTILSLSLSYTQHANHRYTGQSSDKPGDGRFRADGIGTDLFYSDTAKTITVQIYAGNAGLVTWDGDDGKHYRTTGTNLTIHYAKPVYTATFIGNGSTGGGTASQSRYCGEQFTLTNGFTRTDCEFSGWSDAGGTAYDNGARVTAHGDMTFIAHWSAYLTLNGRLDGADSGTLGGYGTADIYINGSLAKQNAETFHTLYPLGTAYEIKNIRPKSGYVYDGPADGSASLKGTVSRLTNIRLAFSKSGYTVAFDGNGGTGTMAARAIRYGEDFSLPANGFGRPGYTFIGWSTDGDAPAALYADKQTVKNIGNSSDTVILYAVWKKTDASWQLDNVVEDDRVFSGDGKIAGGAGTTYDKAHVDSEYARVDSPALPGYFTKKP